MTGPRPGDGLARERRSADPKPVPCPQWGSWRNEVVRMGHRRGKASSKQTELDTKLREKNDDNDDRKLP